MTENESKWDFLYKIGGMTAIGAVLVGVVEIVLTYLPGGNVSHATVTGLAQSFSGEPVHGVAESGAVEYVSQCIGDHDLLRSVCCPSQNSL